MTKTSPRPQLGQKCVIKIQYKRHRVYQGDFRHETQWQSCELPEETTAIYIGYRNLPYGKTIPDDGIQLFLQKGSVYTWLFVVDEKRNPIYVDPQSVTIIEEQT